MKRYIVPDKATFDPKRRSKSRSAVEVIEPRKTLGKGEPLTVEGLKRAVADLRKKHINEEKQLFEPKTEEQRAETEAKLIERSKLITVREVKEKFKVYIPWPKILTELKKAYWDEEDERWTWSIPGDEFDPRVLFDYEHMLEEQHVRFWVRFCKMFLKVRGYPYSQTKICKRAALIDDQEW